MAKSVIIKARVGGEELPLVITGGGGDATDWRIVKNSRSEFTLGYDQKANPTKITWTPSPATIKYNFMSITQGFNGEFYSILNNSNNIFVSNNLMTWTIVNTGLSDLYPRKIIRSDTMIVVTGRNCCITSLDGIVWNKVDMPAGYPFTQYGEIAWNGSIFCVFSDTNGKRSCYTSSDGTSWIQQTVPENKIWGSLVWNGSIFCAVGNDGCMTSPDGVTWTQQTLPVSGANSMEWNGTIFCAVGNVRCVTSPDGINWTAHTIPAGSYSSIVWNGTIFCAAATNGTCIISTDGINWIVQDVSVAYCSLVYWDGNKFYTYATTVNTIGTPDKDIIIETPNLREDYACYDEDMGRNLFDVLGVSTIPDAVNALSARCNGSGVPDFSGLRLGDYIDGISLVGIPAENSGTAGTAWSSLYRNNRIIILGFNTYKGMDSITTNHIVFGFRNCPIRKQMYSTAIQGSGYNTSDLRAFLDGTNGDGTGDKAGVTTAVFLNVLNAQLGGAGHILKIRRLLYNAVSTWGWYYYSLFLPSEQEISGNVTRGRMLMDNGIKIQYPLYRDSIIYRIKKLNAVSTNWWVCSPTDTYSTTHFVTQSISGVTTNNLANDTLVGCSPVFCLY